MQSEFCATGRPLTRARNAAKLAASVAARPAATTSTSPSKPGSAAAAWGASQMMRRLTSTSSGLAGGRSSRSFSAGQVSVKPSPTSSKTSARTRASPGVVSMTPVSRIESRSRSNAAECICSMTPPTRSASLIAALAPSISAPNPAISGWLLRANRRAAAAAASSREAGAPSIDAATSAPIGSFSDIRSARFALPADGDDCKQFRGFAARLDKSRMSGFNRTAIDRGSATNNSAAQGNA